jgi:excisionase family DNA binding protein
MRGFLLWARYHWLGVILNPMNKLKNLRRITLDWLTVEDASSRLNVQPQRVRQLIYDGKLEAGRIGKQIVIYHEDLEAFATAPR